jgi:hypothetical protein
MAVRSIQLAYSGARPAVLAHERAVDGRVHEHQGGGHGAFGGDRVAARRLPRDGTRWMLPPEPVAFGLCVHRGSYRVSIRGHDEYGGQGCRPLLEVCDELRPAGHKWLVVVAGDAALSYGQRGFGTPGDGDDVYRGRMQRPQRLEPPGRVVRRGPEAAARRCERRGRFSEQCARSR